MINLKFKNAKYILLAAVLPFKYISLMFSYWLSGLKKSVFMYVFSQLFSLQFSVLDAVILYTVFCILYCLSPVPVFPSLCVGRTPLQRGESFLLAKTPHQNQGPGEWTFCLAALRALVFETGLPSKIFLNSCGLHKVRWAAER